MGCTGPWKNNIVLHTDKKDRVGGENIFFFIIILFSTLANMTENVIYENNNSLTFIQSSAESRLSTIQSFAHSSVVLKCIFI